MTITGSSGLDPICLQHHTAVLRLKQILVHPHDIITIVQYTLLLAQISYECGKDFEASILIHVSKNGYMYFNMTFFSMG